MKIAIIDKIGLVYNGSTLSSQGLGGSESAVILIAKELSKIGFNVTVFNNCEDKNSHAGYYDNVLYVDNSTAHKFSNERYDIVIVSRTAMPFVDNSYPFLHTARKKILWLHDTFIEGDSLVEDLVVQKKIDHIFTLSDWHTNYILNCTHGKRRNYEVLKRSVFQTRNGAVKYADVVVDLTKKDKNHFVYNSSATKGMVPLVNDIWPNIKKYIPEARLTIIGGYYRFRDGANPDAQENTVSQLAARQDLRDMGITFTGVIPQRQIAEILANAYMMLYPGAFPETFGISTIESLLYKTPLVTTRFGALEETALNDACYLIDYAIEPNVLFTDINKSEQITKFVQTVVNAYNNPYLHQQKQNYCSVIDDIAGWDTVALQWKQFLFNIMNCFLSRDDYRAVSRINDKVSRIFGRSSEMPVRKQFQSFRRPEQKILVISPFYNSEKYIDRCIQSVAQQEYENYEHILIDDVSTDGSYQIAIDTINSLPSDIRSKFSVIKNDTNVGAVKNQITNIRKLTHNTDENTVVMLLDGDDWLVNNNTIFHYYNDIYADDHVEFVYGSSWSLVDNIPLISQDYPEEVKQAKTFRKHHFNWILPYTHLRTFRSRLLNKIPDSAFQDNDGNWYRAGGDGAVFYSLLEQTSSPNSIKVNKEIVYVYNDTNPINDYKVNNTEQNRNARNIVNNSSSSSKKKKILIAVPTSKYIEVENLQALWNIKKNTQHTLDFQHFYGYSRTQVLNLCCEWAKRYDYLLIVNRNSMLEEDTIIECINRNVDLVSIDDAKSIFVSGNTIRSMPYPHFTEAETEIVERQNFIKSAQSMGASFSHVIGKIKTVSKGII